LCRAFIEKLDSSFFPRESTMDFGTQKASADHKLGTGKNAKGNPKITVGEAPYPIYSDFKEFVNAAGSPEAALTFVNAAVKSAAGAKVREFIGDSPEVGTTEDEIISKAIEAGKAFIPVVKTSNREKGVTLDSLLARVRTEGPEAVKDQLLELAAKMG
jgi:hypothetical protein